VSAQRATTTHLLRLGAVAARHGITWLDALTRAAEGNPWISGTT
jgi:hypothetical protein